MQWPWSVTWPCLNAVRCIILTQIEHAAILCVQGFAKSLLEVADNLERALSSAGEEQQAPSAETALAQLQSLRSGLNLTQKILMQVTFRGWQAYCFCLHLNCCQDINIFANAAARPVHKFA